MKGYTASILLILSIPIILISANYTSNIITSIIVLSFAVSIIYTLGWAVEDDRITEQTKCDP